MAEWICVDTAGVCAALLFKSHRWIMVWPVLASLGHQHNKAQRWGGDHFVLHSSQQQALPGHVRPRPGAAEGLRCTGQVNLSPQGRIVTIYKNLNNYMIFLGARYQCTESHSWIFSTGPNRVPIQYDEEISRDNYCPLILQCFLHFFKIKN